MTKHIPNLLTLANLFCGCCALANIFGGALGTAAWFTAACFFFDYLDGMAARLLKVSSPLGKELDSLADVISFGAVPGAMLYAILTHAQCGQGGSLLGQTLDLQYAIGVCPAAFPAFVLSAFSGLRLAKFNIDNRQTTYFLGLSTPACTVFVLGLALAWERDRFGLRAFLQTPALLYALIAGLSWLLVSEVPMFGMKIKLSGWRDNALLIGFVALFVVLFFLLKELAFSAIIVFYIVSSIFLMKD